MAIRICTEVTSDEIKAMSKLKRRLGLENVGEVFNQALKAYFEIIEETDKGHRIHVIDNDHRVMKIIKGVPS